MVRAITIMLFIVCFLVTAIASFKVGAVAIAVFIAWLLFGKDIVGNDE